MKRTALFALAAIAPLAAQQPRILNARLETRNAGNLQSTFQSIVAAQEAPAWVAYTVPVVPGNGQSCCWSDGTRGCGLEGNNMTVAAPGRPVMLEGPTTLVVLFRISSHSVDKMRTVSGDCDLDAGGLPVLMLSGVRPAESVALLESMIDKTDTGARNEKQNNSNRAISAIALHADPAADQALERLTSTSSPVAIREKTVFWLGSTRGRAGYEMLKRIAQNDPSEQVRDKVMFAYSVSKEPEAVNSLIDAAKNDKSPKVRGQALFWLAHKAGQKEAAFIRDQVDNDPDTQVKRRAVAALEQLPKDQGVPLLIQVARTNKNPEVRKQAMFWLGQSKDPRAIAFFQEVLTK